MLSAETGNQLQYEAKGLLVSRNDDWQKTHAAWQPFFKAESLVKQAPLMSQMSDKLVSLLKPKAESGEVFDMLHEIGRQTLAVVGTIAFGVPLHTLDEEVANKHQDGPEGASIQAACRAVFDSFGVANVSIAVRFLFEELDLLIAYIANIPGLESAVRKKEKSAKAVLRNLVTSLAYSAKDKFKGADIKAMKAGGVDPGSFLALLTSTPESQDEWVASNANTFLLGGYETTASGLAFTIAALCANPLVEQKLLQEIDAFGRDKTPTIDNLRSEFPYTQGVWKESLRLFPPGTIIIREAPHQLLVGKYSVPEGTRIHVDLYSIMRSTFYWKDPLHFKPERFIEGSLESRESNIEAAYHPFGMGSRMCIGYKFANQEALISLIKLYQTYTFTLKDTNLIDPDTGLIRGKTTLTHAPKGGVHVTVHNR